MSTSSETIVDTDFPLQEVVDRLRASFGADWRASQELPPGQDEHDSGVYRQYINPEIIKRACHSSRIADRSRYEARRSMPPGQYFRLTLAIGDCVVSIDNVTNGRALATREYRHPVTQEINGLAVVGRTLSRGALPVNHGNEPLAYLSLGGSTHSIAFAAFNEEALGGLQDRLSVVSGLTASDVASPLEQVESWLQNQPLPNPIPAGIR